MTVWIYTDADNTLWDTDALFAQAQLGLLDAAESVAEVVGPSIDRLQYVRAFDQAIAARHHQRLRYPPALLLRALCSGLRGASIEAATQRALHERAAPVELEEAALRVYADDISGVPPILTGVVDGLMLAQRYAVPIYVLTEGPLDTARARLQAHDLERFTMGVLSAQKTRELYVRLKQRADPNPAAMIGDQPDRDCRFAKEAGMAAILVRGRFRPAWIRTSDAAYADAVVEDYVHAIRTAINLGSSPGGAEFGGLVTPR